MTMTITPIPATQKGIKEYNRIISELTNQGFSISSPRRKSGYLSRKLIAVIRTYSGTYGDGFTIEKPAFDSTGMHWVQYAIKPETADK